MGIRIFSTLFLTFTLSPLDSNATPLSSPVIASSGLPIPRFVSLKAEEANARTGPSVRYPVRWTYKRKHLPLEIVAEFEGWRKTRDVDGDEGWMHESLLSGQRFAHVSPASKELAMLYHSNSTESLPVLRAEPGAILKLAQCDDHWCQIEANDTEAWIPKNELWGIYESETLDK